MDAYSQFGSVSRPLIFESTKTLQKGIKGLKYLLRGFWKICFYTLPARLIYTDELNEE